MAEESKTPLADQLESGSWPSFVKEIKKRAAVNAASADLLGQLELSYEEKKVHWKMDIAMPILDGLEATRRIKDRFKPVKVLILTQHENREYVFPILKAGADGYVLKKAAGTELVSAIKAVHDGGTFLYPSVARAVVEDYLRPDGTISDRRHSKLTDREIEILKLVAEGRSNQEIADMLCLSVKTVTGHRTNIMEKLDIHSRTELVKYAIRTGLIQV